MCDGGGSKDQVFEQDRNDWIRKDGGSVTGTLKIK